MKQMSSVSHDDPKVKVKGQGRDQNESTAENGVYKQIGDSAKSDSVSFRIYKALCIIRRTIHNF